MQVKIIAEIGQAHEGSLGILHSYIDAVASTGADCIKFQTHLAHAESSLHEPFRVKFSYEDKTRYDYWQRMEFSEEQWVEIKQHCEEKNLQFLSSPFSITAVDMLHRIGLRDFKIGSGEVTNLVMLEKLCRMKVDNVYLSSGMSSFKELDRAVELVKNNGIPLSVFQCTSAYPTQPEELGLNVIKQLAERYDVPVGFSDHSGSIVPPILAVAHGATLIESHVTFDKRMFGPDAKASLTIDEFKAMVDAIRLSERAMNSTIDKDNVERFANMKNTFQKSLAVKKALNKGDTIEFDDLETKKPMGYGINAEEYGDILGKKVNKNLAEYDFLTYEDLE